MATRDRTALFLRYREEARMLHRHSGNHVAPPHTSNEAGDDGEAAPDAITRTGGMSPDWYFSYTDLKDDMIELDKQLEQLGALYVQHVLPSFGEHDTSEMEREIRVRAHRLSQGLHACEHKVRDLGKAARRRPAGDTDSDANKAADVDRAICTNLQKRFAAPLQKLSSSFRKRQKDYLDKLRALRETSGENEASLDVPGGSVRHAQHGEKDDDARFTESQLLVVENSSALAEERRRELQRVAANINDLATLVKDIAALVVEQGTVLDRVDYNVEEVREKTTGAVRELRIAERYQRKRHAVCCIIMLAVGCGIMSLILIYKWTS